MSGRRWSVVAAILVACGVVISAVPAGSAGGVVRIGVAGPLTGSYAAFGEQLWRGAEQAAKDINAAGGIDGRMIELVKTDDACEPKQAVNVAHRLVDAEKVKAVIGHFCSSSTIPATEIYAEAGILAMTPGSTNPKVTERNLPTVFRTCGRDDQQGGAGAEYVVQKLKAKRIAIIHDKDTYGQGLADAMRARLHALGLKEVLYEGLTRGEKDFNALVTKIKSQTADAVYFGGLHAEAGVLVRQMREQGLQAPLISGDGIVSQEFVASAGGPRFVENVYMTFGRDARKIYTGRKVVESFRKAGYEPEGYTLYSYATLQSIAAAMTATRSEQGDLLAQWLHSNKVDTIMGSKAWDAKGDLQVTDYVMYRWSSDGTYQEAE
ncbi:MAG: branched-chain amino acid ABC transporter substrate-binding protein [Magnetococcales bacterium]|nr:branched-chain amino acid ABC transporter substrate-binding protein [Magnetococcales bacterium]